MPTPEVYSDRTSYQVVSNQQVNPSTASSAGGNMDRAAKARQTRLDNQAREWEQRLQRMGLGVDSGTRNDGTIEYGAQYYPDTVPFNYGNEEEAEEHVYYTKPLNFWPGAEDTHVNYRTTTVGGQV